MSLAQQIAEAFTDVSRPRDDAVFASDSEGADTVFCGRDWRDLEPRDLAYHSFALSVFTPEAFAYYLPAFMLGALSEATSGFPDILIDRLSPPKSDPSRPSFAGWWERLNRAQQRTIVAFLRHYSSRNPVAIEVAASTLEHAYAGSQETHRK